MAGRLLDVLKLLEIVSDGRRSLPLMIRVPPRLNHQLIKNASKYGLALNRFSGNRINSDGLSDQLDGMPGFDGMTGSQPGTAVCVTDRFRCGKRQQYAPDPCSLNPQFIGAYFLS